MIVATSTPSVGTQDVLPRLERTAIGVSVLSRGLDDQAHLFGTPQQAMPDMGALLAALAEAVRTLMRDVLGEPGDTDVSARSTRFA